MTRGRLRRPDRAGLRLWKRLREGVRGGGSWSRERWENWANPLPTHTLATLSSTGERAGGRRGGPGTPQELRSPCPSRGHPVTRSPGHWARGGRTPGTAGSWTVLSMALVVHLVSGAGLCACGVGPRHPNRDPALHTYSRSGRLDLAAAAAPAKPHRVSGTEGGGGCGGRGAGTARAAAGRRRPHARLASGDNVSIMAQRLLRGGGSPGWCSAVGSVGARWGGVRGPRGPAGWCRSGSLSCSRPGPQDLSTVSRASP